MRFELTESNRHGMRSTGVILGLVITGAVVAFGCSDSGDEGLGLGRYVDSRTSESSTADSASASGVGS